MNKPSKFALALAFAAVTASGVASAQSYPNTVDNWRNPFGNVWKNGTNELCWRDAFWTPATGIPGCDGVPVAQQKAKPTPQAAKVVFNADTFFDFDKSTLKPEGRQLLDQVAQQAQGIDLKRSSPSATPTRSALTPTTRSCPSAVPLRSRPTWSARALIRTVSTPKAGQEGPDRFEQDRSGPRPEPSR